MEDPDSKEFSILLDDWCERVESTSRRHCEDLSEKIRFYPEDDAISVEGDDIAAIECIMQAIVEHQNTMDTSLTGACEMVLRRLESKREEMLRTQRK